MELETRAKTKSALLDEEMGAILYANGLSWKRGAFQTMPRKPTTNLGTRGLEEIRDLERKNVVVKAQE